MRQPKISIIVPVYNVKKYLPQCLDSLINQTFRDIEFICVNDGSTDESLSILEDYAKKDVRVKVISKENEGVSIARNTALDHAAGSYIMFVDSDDWIELNTCQCALEAIEEHGVDLVMWDYIRELSNIQKPKNIFNHDVEFDEETVKSKLHRRMVGIIREELAHPENADALCTIWGKLYKRSYIEKYNVRFYDIKEIGTYEDGLFNLEVFSLIKNAFYLHKFLYHYRRTNELSSITSAFKPKLQSQRERLYMYMEEYIASNNLGEEYEIALNNRKAFDLIAYGNNILRNNRGFVYSIKSIKNIISNPIYHEAYKRLETVYFPIHWKVFYFFAKNKLPVCLYFLFSYIKTRRNGK